MTSRTRALAAAAGTLVAAGFVVFALTSDGTDTTTASEGLGVAAVCVGLAAAALIPALGFWRRPMPAKTISFGAYALAGLLVLTAISGLIGAGREAPVEAASSPAPSLAAVVPTVSPRPTAPATPSPRPSSTATPAPAATPAPTATPVPTATPIPATAQLADPAGDYLDENDEPVKEGPPSTDIRSVQAVIANGRLDLAMDIAEVPPPVDPVSHQQLYGWSIDTTGDGTPDWQVLVQNTDAENEMNIPGWTAGFMDLVAARAHDASEFPGTVDFKGTHLHVGLPLDAIGSPTGMVRVIAYTEDIEFPDMQNDPFTSIQRDDKAPDHQWPDGADWVTIAVP